MIGHYEQQVAAHTARRDAETVLSVRISRLRLATVVPGIALLVIAGARTFSAAALIAGLVFLLIFLVLVVWHAKAGTRGVLAHTISSFAFARVSVNGVEAGEAALYGAVAAEFAVPVAFLSGDDVFVAETSPLYPGAVAVTTKRAHGNRVATSVSPEAACAKIRAGAREAVAAARLSKLKPSQAPYALSLEATSAGLADLFALLPIVKRVDGVTIEWTSPTMRHALRVLNSLSAMSFMLH